MDLTLFFLNELNIKQFSQLTFDTVNSDINHINSSLEASTICKSILRGS